MNWVALQTVVIEIVNSGSERHILEENNVLCQINGAIYYFIIHRDSCGLVLP